MQLKVKVAVCAALVKARRDLRLLQWYVYQRVPCLTSMDGLRLREGLRRSEAERDSAQEQLQRGRAELLLRDLPQVCVVAWL